MSVAATAFSVARSPRARRPVPGEEGNLVLGATPLPITLASNRAAFQGAAPSRNPSRCYTHRHYNFEIFAVGCKSAVGIDFQMM